MEKKPKLDAKIVSATTKKYFEEVKTTPYFFFEIKSSTYNSDLNVWIIDCEVKNVFEELTRVYRVTVNDPSGEITDVQRID